MAIKKSFLYDLILFLVLNFGALAIGGLLMGEGPSSNYYSDLNKAPWTPPGWVFGAAWFTIMLCFSVYMASWKSIQKSTSNLWLLFGIQWVLNVLWNPVFFLRNLPIPSLLIISCLTALVGYILFSNRTHLGLKSLLISPYFIWLCIATSLNAYIILYN